MRHSYWARQGAGQKVLVTVYDLHERIVDQYEFEQDDHEDGATHRWGAWRVACLDESEVL